MFPLCDAVPGVDGGSCERPPDLSFSSHAASGFDGQPLAKRPTHETETSQAITYTADKCTTTPMILWGTRHVDCFVVGTQPLQPAPEGERVDLLGNIFPVSNR